MARAGGTGPGSGSVLGSMALPMFAVGFMLQLTHKSLATMSIASKSRNLCDIFTRIVKIGKFIARARGAIAAQEASCIEYRV